MSEVKFNACMELERWILVGKIHAQPKKAIIKSLQMQFGKSKENNPYRRLNNLIQEYEKRTGRIIAYDEYGSLYFPKDEEELGEFLTRAKNIERRIADGKLAEQQSYEDRGFWPDPQALHEDRTKTMLRDHSLTIPRYSTLENMTKSLREAEKKNEELEARIEALEQRLNREADSQ